MTKVSIGSDHAGLEAKARVAAWLEAHGYQVLDRGTHDAQSVDYPDYARNVAKDVAGGAADRGVLVCGTGIGMSIAANKVKGVRASLCHDRFTAEMARRHNDANVLCLGARVLVPEAMQEILAIWMSTDFEGGRHEGRVRKIESTPHSLP